MTPQVITWVAYLLAVWQATTMVEDDKVASRVLDPTENFWNSHYHRQWNDWCLLIQNHTCEGEDCIHLCEVECNDSDAACWRGSLLQGLMIQNAYTEMCNDSKSVTIMVRNGMAFPQMLKKKIPVARLVAANYMPEAQMQPVIMEALDEVQGIQTRKMTTEQRRKMLFEKIDLSSLGSWPPELADPAHSLHAEYHDIFSLESCEFICTYLMERLIRVTDDAPFKEWFRQIPLPFVEEVHAYLWEMLDSDMIHHSQSAWCNTIVLVQKEE